MVAVHQVCVDPTAAASVASHDSELVPYGTVAFASQFHHGLFNLLSVTVIYPALASSSQPAVVVGNEEEADIRVDLAQLVHEDAVRSLERPCIKS